MKKIILKIYTTFYSYMFEPIFIFVIILRELIFIFIEKIIKTINNFINSDVLFICILLSFLNRTLLKFFYKEFGFELLLMILLVSIVSTLFKITINIARGKKCDFEIILTKFLSSFGFTLIFMLAFTLLKIYVQ